MTRKLMLALAVVAVATVLLGGAASAKFVQCLGGQCLGTAQSDVIAGFIKPDVIVAGDGDDRITEPLVDGDDDTIRGGRGNDTINDFNPAVDKDRVFGGPGNDFINVRETFRGTPPSGGPDYVDCGPGDDTVIIDEAAFDATDTAVNCEHVNVGV